MPTFEFTAPNGKSYSVDGPDGATPEQAFQILQSQIGGDAGKSVGVGEDLGKVAVAAPGRLVAGIAGMPGDLYHLGLRALGDKLTPESAYGSHAIQQALGSDYQAETEPGRLAQKGVDFLPAVVGGPETLGAKLLTRVAAPAIGSEIGESVGGPIGGIAGAVVGAGSATAAARKFQQMAAAKQAASALPSGEDLIKTGGAQFDQARDMNVIVKPDFATNAAADMRSAVKGFDPEAHKPVFAAADRLENLAGSGPLQTAVAMNDVDFIRKELTSLKTSADASTREAARRAIGSLQKSQLALTPADTLAGDAGAFTKLTSDAIGNWRQGKLWQTLQGKANLAELNQNSPVGMLDAATGGQALQRTMKQLARPVNNTNMPVARKLGFNNEETALINQAASGTKMQHAAELMDRLIPAKLGAIPAMIARQIGGLTTKRQVSALDSLVRARSPLAAQVASQLPPQLVAQLPSKTQRLLQSMRLASPAVSKAFQGQGEAIGQSNP